MDIKNILEMYGRTDYIDMNTGYIYELSNITYDPKENKSIIPVKDSLYGTFLGVVKIDGDYTTEMK